MEPIKHAGTYVLYTILVACIVLSGCASSQLQKTTATNIDNAYLNSSSALSHMGDNGIAAYPNASGVAQGAGAGAIVGASALGLHYGSPGAALVGAAGGVIVGGVLGAFINHNATVIEQLENHGAKVLVLGDHCMVVIPANQVFRDSSPAIYPLAYATLDLVGKMVRDHTTMLVKVMVYSDGSGPEKVSLALTQQQAEAVAKYLWAHVNTRVLSASGLGNQNLVTLAGNPINARIEVTFEALPV